MREKQVGNSLIRIIQGDITHQDTEAIVNAANTRLAPGGGVAGAIHRTAGPKLWEECKKLNGCKTGEAKITKGYDLDASYVIHTVGPIYSGTNNDEKKLTSCYKNSLDLASIHHLKSISFPAISAGIFGYPIKDVARISLKVIYDWLQQNQQIMLVQFVLFDEKDQTVFETELDRL